MFLVEVTTEFCASHQLRLPGGVLEPMHGHNFQLTVQVAADALDGMDTVVDFHEVERALGAITGRWNNRHLNEVMPFGGADGVLRVNPSAERIAEAVGQMMGEAVKEDGRGVRVTEVRVTEAPGCLAVWRAE